MARIVVLGGGVCGLASAMVLARDGHEVTVLERDEAAVPSSIEEAWQNWSRDGVTQFRQAHFLPPRGRAVLEELLPDVSAALVAAGAARFDALPPPLAGAARAGDAERYVTYTARRPTIEYVVARAAGEEAGVEIRRGVAVKELVMRSHDARPHVTGVRVESGEVVEADLVVDAMGRGSQLQRWLSATGIGPMHEESEDCGFIYYTRFFRSSDGATPESQAPLLSPIGTFSILTLPADNDTWSVTIYVASGDRPLKRMRDEEPWTAVVRACPLQAHWLEGEPISPVWAMGGVIDRYRRLATNGTASITGLALLGDACACTNPSQGRGITLGLMHARCLREVVGSHLENPGEFAAAFDAGTEAELTPWYRETVAEDRDRLREIEALRNGREPPEPADASSALRRGLIAAMPYDPDLLLAFLESRCCLTPLNETFAEPGVAERITALASEHEILPLPGPSREELLALLA
jgi:2-polyprenyl-6-methoxyphenol hydroxylase-like FAD-dependent oxidoreductase